jgi:fermentation-respiration switch protein FrsA (DUF1100 family)
MNGNRREELITAAGEGARIHGMIHLPADAAGPVPGVLLLHGFTGSSSADNRLLVRQARLLADTGIAALRFDFRGSGQSEGEFADVTISGEVDDAVIMLRVLADHPAVDAGRLGVLGLSLGGAVAGCLLGRIQPPRALVLWAPVAAPHELILRVAAASGIKPDAKTGQGDVFGEMIGPGFVLELPSIKPLDFVMNTQVPLLVAHGTNDRTVPFDEGYRYIEAAAGPRRSVAIEGADHTFQAVPWRAELYAVTTAWFRQYL